MNRNDRVLGSLATRPEKEKHSNL